MTWRKGNPRISTRVDAAANAALRGMALLRGITVSELVRQILSDWARKEIKDPHRKVAVILGEFDDLVKRLELDIIKLAVTKIPLQEQKGVELETQNERLRPAIGQSVERAKITAKTNLM